MHPISVEKFLVDMFLCAQNVCNVFPKAEVFKKEYAHLKFWHVSITSPLKGLYSSYLDHSIRMVTSFSYPTPREVPVTKCFLNGERLMQSLLSSSELLLLSEGTQF